MSLKISDKTIITISSFSFLFAIIAMIVVYFVATKYNIPFKEITGDPALTFEANPLTGVLSNLGILLWCATTSITLFTAVVLGLGQHKKESVFHICSGLITGLLLIDDLFMIHDYIFYSVGLHQNVMYTIYLFIFTLYCLYFKNRILRAKNLLLLLLAFLFLGSSLGMDLFLKNEGIQYFYEDGFKFFGIISWFLFFSFTSFNAIKDR